MYAAEIRKDSSLKLDETASALANDVEFQGSGHLGAMKKTPSQSGAFQAPVFEGREDYAGRFHLKESLDGCGWGFRSSKSVSGAGFVSSDKRLKESQRTYEYGSGLYKSEEIISSPESYITKDLKASYAPSNYSYVAECMAGVGDNHSVLWNDGTWSRNQGISYIGQEISGSDYLESETVSSGLTDMSTEASYSGTGRFKSYLKQNDRADRNVDVEETYSGKFSIRRNIHLDGVARYDEPHLHVTKAGTAIPGTTCVRYDIDILNDGNSALGPVYVRDIFPEATDYLNSSVRPSNLKENYANWTLICLAIGQSVRLATYLNITEDVSSLINRVCVSGAHDDRWITACNYSAIHYSWLGCCPSKVSLIKEAKIDPNDPLVVWYRPGVINNTGCSVVAKVSDRLPGGMRLLNSSLLVENDPLLFELSNTLDKTWPN